MRFSVIIPVYNSEEYLHKCLDSILMQEYNDYELILIDDGSTDSSREICGSYAAQYSNVHLICQENCGPSAARNRGISLARGEYITFVDSDDWVKPEYFQTLHCATTEDPDLVFFGIGHFNGTTETEKVFPAKSVCCNENVIAFVSQNYLMGDICSVVNKAFNRRCLLGGGIRFPAGTVVEEDLQFVLHAVDSAESLKSIQKVLYCYNQREFGSITTKHNPVKFDSKRNAYQAQLRMAEKWKDTRLEQIFHDNYLSYVSSCINNLMYRACEMSQCEKIAEIRRFYSADETIACISRSKGLSPRSKVMYTLIKLRLYRLSYMIHYFIFHIRRR